MLTAVISRAIFTCPGRAGPGRFLGLTAHRHSVVSARSRNGTPLCHYCRQCQMHLRDATRYRSNIVTHGYLENYAFSQLHCIRQHTQRRMGVILNFYVNRYIFRDDMRHTIFIFRPSDFEVRPQKCSASYLPLSLNVVYFSVFQLTVGKLQTGGQVGGV